MVETLRKGKGNEILQSRLQLVLSLGRLPWRWHAPRALLMQESIDPKA